MESLMFLGRTDEARLLYLKYRAEKNVQDNQSWVRVILDDFAELRKAGLTDPLMYEISNKFAPRNRERHGSFLANLLAKRHS